MSTVLNDRDVLLQGTSPRNLDPSAGKALLLSVDTPVFHVSTAGAGTPTAITLTAQPLNIPVSATWSCSAGGTLTGSSANIRTLAFTDMTVASVTVTAQVAYNGITYSAAKTITKVVDGALGPLAATASMFQWGMTAPAAPTGTTTFTWATGVNSAYSVADGWSVAPPTNPGTPALQLWMVSKPLAVAGGTTTSTVGYTGLSVVSIAVNGATGATGAPGVKSAIARAYQWALSAPPATGSATYTWSTASYDNVPATGWSMSKPAAPGAGYSLYEVAVGLVDGTGATTASVNWSTGSVTGIGYVAVNGSSASICYSLVTGSTLATTPATFTATGTARPTTGTWGETVAWQASPPATGSGQSVFQSNGVYNPATNQTVWGVPYLSSWKVGSLSVISANLGSITAGTINGITITGTTITGGVLQTASTGSRVVINEAAANSIRIYGDAGGGLELLSSIGLDGSYGGAVGRFGSYLTTSNVPGVLGYSGSGIGVTAQSYSNQGLLASSTSSYAIFASSSTGIGMSVQSGTRDGLDAFSFGGTGNGISSSSANAVGVYGGGATYDFYAGGGGVNYGPFTGGHDGLARLDAAFLPGDLLVDVSIVRRSSLSNTIAENAMSSSPMQKSVIGVFVFEQPLDSEHPPAALTDRTLFASTMGPPRKGNPCAEFDNIAAVYKRIAFNALGEGQVNVCGEGGDILAGDYITTSSTPGKGMRQSTDVLHNYTVAKARESVTFSTPDEVKLVACTYHCG